MKRDQSVSSIQARDCLTYSAGLESLRIPLSPRQSLQRRAAKTRPVGDDAKVAQPYRIALNHKRLHRAERLEQARQKAASSSAVFVAAGFGERSDAIRKRVGAEAGEGLSQSRSRSDVAHKNSVQALAE